MSDLDAAADALARGGVVAFTGAGMSAEAGIPTFRDPGGLWERFDPERFGTWDGLGREAMERPTELAAFLGELRSVLASARPGAGHLALARLEAAGILEAIVTQNVDGLHQEAGASRVVEIHGTFSRLAGVACAHRTRVDRAEMLEGLDRAVTGLRSSFVPSLASVLPRCPECGRPARPDFVAFGEPPQDFEEAERLVSGARTLLVVGTSGEVFPAAALPGIARRAGARVIDIGRGSTEVEADQRIEGKTGLVLPRLVERVLARYPGPAHGG